MVVETIIGLGLTSVVGYVVWMHNKVNSHAITLAEMAASFKRVDERIAAVVEHAAHRHTEVREDLREVKQTLATINDHLLRRTG